MARRTIFAASVLALVTTIGCHRAPPPMRDAAVIESKPLPTGPLTAHFKEGEHENDLVTDGHPEYTFKLTYGVKGELNIAAVGLADWPGGTKIILGKQEANLVNYGSASLKDASILGDLPIAEAKDGGSVFRTDKVEITPPGELVVRFTNGTEIKVPLPKAKLLPFVTDDVMKAAAKDGLTFVGEGDHKGPHTTFYLPDQASSAIVGPGTKLVDADWIALSKSTTAKVEGKTCAFNTGSVYPLEVVTETVTIVDRRTKATIAEKVFTPSRIGCPSFAMGGHATIGAGRDSVFAWIRETAKAH